MKKLTSALLCLILIAVCCAAQAASGDPMRITNICMDNVCYATVAVPQSYTVVPQFTNSGTYESLGNQIHLYTYAASRDGEITFGYFSPRDFEEYISSNFYKHVEGQLDTETWTYMIRYQTAAQYADNMVAGFASALNTTAVQEYESEIDPQLQHVLDTLATEKLRIAKANLAPLQDSIVSMKVTDNGITFADRWYSMTYNGQAYRIRAVAFTEYTTMQMSNSLVTSTLRSWTMPSAWFAIYPEARASEALKIFDGFLANTRINNNFVVLNQDLSAQVRGVKSQTNERAFSDYIFDQNEYVTSGGDRVKVSTAYDYVWQVGNDVFFSDSALDMPYGADRLYAR